MAGLVGCGLRALMRVGLRNSEPSSKWCPLQRPAACSSQIAQYSSYEPDDLDVEPEIPEYELLNIRMRGYDFVVLESFAKYVHSLVKNLDVDNDAFAVPAKTSHVQLFKPNSTNVDATYDLAMYERTIQVEDLPSTTAPILFEVIQQHLPEGIQVTVKEPDPEEEEFRYVPDIMLMELQNQIEEMDREREERRK